jgi:hypothetical protein
MMNKYHELKERFFNFETLNGLFFLIWGSGFIYCGFFDRKLGYDYALVSIGLMLITWGIRKMSVNRIKQAIEVEKLIDERKKAEGL